MDRGNCRNSKIHKPTEDLLPALNKSAHLAGFRSLQQRLQIRTCDKDGFFCRRDDQAVQRSVFLDGIEVLIQLLESSVVENVRAEVRPIEREHANVIVASLPPNHWNCTHYRHSLHFGTFPANAKCRRPELTVEAG